MLLESRHNTGTDNVEESVRYRNVYHGMNGTSFDTREDYVSIAIDTDGKVYTWGVHHNGGLGHGTDTILVQHPTQVLHGLGGLRVLSVAMGYAHCIAVAEVGSVFTWGIGDRGKCGHIDENSQPLRIVHSPKRVEALSSLVVRHAAAGKNHSLVVTEGGKVFAFGSGQFGQLGLGNGHHTDTNEPRRVLFEFTPDDQPPTQTYISTVAAGAYHSLAICIHGSVFSWGLNDFGQTGQSECDRLFTIDTPQKLTAFKRMNFHRIAAGNSSSFALTQEGALYTWGSIRNHAEWEDTAPECSKDFPEFVRVFSHSRVSVISVAQRERMDFEHEPGWSYQSEVIVVTDTGHVHVCREGNVLSAGAWEQHTGINCRRKNKLDAQPSNLG